MLGDARERGETHQWMYDYYNLSELLKDAGFRDITRKNWNESAISNWRGMGLEVAQTGEEYKPTSLYVECIK